MYFIVYHRLFSGNHLVQNTSFESDHRICTDMVVNLKRSLRASESANMEVQKQVSFGKQRNGWLFVFAYVGVIRPPMKGH